MLTASREKFFGFYLTLISLNIILFLLLASGWSIINVLRLRTGTLKQYKTSSNTGKLLT